MRLTKEMSAALKAWQGLSESARGSVFVTYKLGAEHSEYNEAALAALNLLRAAEQPEEPQCKHGDYYDVCPVCR